LSCRLRVELVWQLRVGVSGRAVQAAGDIELRGVQFELQTVQRRLDDLHGVSRRPAPLGHQPLLRRLRTRLVPRRRQPLLPVQPELRSLPLLPLELSELSPRPAARCSELLLRLVRGERHLGHACEHLRGLRSQLLGLRELYRPVHRLSQRAVPRRRQALLHGCFAGLLPEQPHEALREVRPSLCTLRHQRDQLHRVQLRRLVADRWQLRFLRTRTAAVQQLLL